MPSGIGLPDGTLVAAGKTEYRAPSDLFDSSLSYHKGSNPDGVWADQNHEERFVAWERGTEERSFLWFDTTDLPMDFTKVVLQLYFELGDTTKGPVEIQFAALAKPWDEGVVPSTVGSSFLPAWPPTTEAGITHTGIVPGWVDLNITELVRNWQADPSTNMGIMLSGPVGEKSVVWFYGHNSDAAHQPRLLITR
jgi:hypothetical protein